MRQYRAIQYIYSWSSKRKSKREWSREKHNSQKFPKLLEKIQFTDARSAVNPKQNKYNQYNMTSYQLFESKDKKKILKAARQKSHIMYRSIMVQIVLTSYQRSISMSSRLTKGETNVLDLEKAICSNSGKNLCFLHFTFYSLYFKVSCYPLRY